MEGVFQVTALAMRFWFMIVAAIVLLGVTGISIKEYRDKRYVLDVAQSSIGYLYIVSGPEDVMEENITLLQSNTIGRARKCDIVLADRSIDKVHAQIDRALSGAVYLFRTGQGEVTVDGKSVERRARLYAGALVCFGNVVAEVYLKEESE